DHYLARGWGQYSDVALDDFVQEVYGSLEAFRAELPAEAWARLNSMRAWNLLGSYRSREGIRRALDRIGRRLRRPVELAAGADFLETHERQFRGDFEEFFPELRRFVAGG